jgi:hypothetical protein
MKLPEMSQGSMQQASQDSIRGQDQDPIEFEAKDANILIWVPSEPAQSPRPFSNAKLDKPGPEWSESMPSYLNVALVLYLIYDLTCFSKYCR